jgi:lipopolysaccharide export system permease protein
MKSYKEGEKAKDVLLITKNKSEQRLGLMTAKELSIKGDLLYGKDVSFISSIDPHEKKGFDHLIVENQHTMNTKASALSKHIQTAGWLKKSEYLPLKLLIAKQQIEQKGYIETNRYAVVEIAKRVTLGIAAFTFTMIGVSFGAEIGRQRRKKGTLYAVALAALFMICFVSTKSLKNSPSAAVLAYLLPHPIILFFCLVNMKKVAKGVE